MMKVYRGTMPSIIDGRNVPVIYKHIRTAEEERFAIRHHLCLDRMGGTRFAPHSLLVPGVNYGYGNGRNGKEVNWPEEDVGQGKVLAFEDEVKFQRGCIDLLNALAERGIRHGDLTRHNIIVRNGLPVAIDFHEALLQGETAEPKRPEGDAFWLWHAASEISPDTTRRIRRWRAIRPYLVPNTTLIDYGCAQGDFVAMAEAEHIGIDAFGYDIDETAVSGAIVDNLVHDDITKLKNYKCDTALFMSVFPHLINSHGLGAAMETLNDIVAGARQTFFETQLFGDGPGPEWLKSDGDVNEMLHRILPIETTWQKIVEVPVYGRAPHTRTVWRIVNENDA